MLPLTTEEIVETNVKLRDLDESTLRILAPYAGGNPRVLLEQVARLQADQLRGAASLLLPPPPTHTMTQVTARTLDGLSPTAHAILQLAALSPLSNLAALNKILPGACDDVGDLIATGLLERELHDERLAAWHHISAAPGARSVDQLLGAAIALLEEARLEPAVEFAEEALSRVERVEDHAKLLIELCGRLLKDGHLLLAGRYSARSRRDDGT